MTGKPVCGGIPNACYIALYLSYAEPSAEHPEVERERIAANAALSTVYREQLNASEAATREGRPAPQIDPRLKMFFDRASRRIWGSPDPVEAMREFLHGKPEKPKSGRKREPDADERNLLWAVWVEELRGQGKTVDDACREVAQRIGRSPGLIRTVYERRDKRDVALSIDLRRG